MSWMQRLYDTYEQATKLELPQDKHIPPVGHLRTPTAHVKVVLNEKAQCVQASVQLDKNFSIVLPVTEESQSRTSTKTAPHGIADKLQYVAQNLSDFLPDVSREKKKYLSESFEKYFKQLNDWCNAGAPKKVQVVRDYVKRGDVISDLVKHGIFLQDQQTQKLQVIWAMPENKADRQNLPAIVSRIGVTDEKTKAIQINPSEAVIFWAVQIPGIASDDVQEDVEVQTNWISFQSGLEAQEGFCHVVGKETFIASKHAKVVGNTKLITSDDKKGYTFRGKFDEVAQAVAIGSEVSQKAHNALRWLIARQGVKNSDQVTVAWAISGKPVLSPVADWCFDDDEPAFTLDDATKRNATDHSNDLGRYIAQKIKLKLKGYQQELTATEQLSLMVLDSATPGRMSIGYYREFSAKDYFKRLDTWYEEFSWYQRISKEIDVPGKAKKVNRTVWIEAPPSPLAIVQAVRGVTLPDDFKKFKKQTFSTVLRCIAEGEPFPRVLMQAAVNRVSNPLACEVWEWERNLGVACALYKGFYARHTQTNERKDYSMDIDANTGRSYCFGRMLAIAEKVESIALTVQEKNRPTAAMRLMQRFSVQPMTTWENLEKALPPYWMRIQNNYPPLVGAYKDLIGQQMEVLHQMNGFTNTSLDGEYLLGYHLQRRWFEQHQFKKGAWISKNAAEETDAVTVDD